MKPDQIKAVWARRQAQPSTRPANRDQVQVEMTTEEVEAISAHIDAIKARHGSLMPQAEIDRLTAERMARAHVGTGKTTQRR